MMRFFMYMHPTRHCKHAVWLSLIIGLSLLSSCGFHWREDNKLAADLSPAFNSAFSPAFSPAFSHVHVTGADRELIEKLSTQLTQRGAVLVTHEDAINTTRINILIAEFKREVLTTDRNGRASGYTIHYRVMFSVSDEDDSNNNEDEKDDTSPYKTKTKTKTIALQRAFHSAPNQPLQAAQEVQFLENEMRDESVRRMLQQLDKLH